ncbi:MAG: hypothetical protein QM817_42225 [Archangium sp.]
MSARRKSPDNRTSEAPALERWWPLVLFAATLAVYWPSLSNGLTNWDDPEYVVHNPFAAAGVRGLLDAFTTPFDGAWYPLTQAVYVLLALVGASISTSHLVQLSLFAVGVALVPAALHAFGVERRIGVLVAVLWALHPLRVESVVWLANVKDALGVTLVIAAFALYGLEKRAASFAVFAAALLAKSAFFGLGFAFPLLELAKGTPAVAARRTAPWVVVGVAIAVVAGLLHLSESHRPPGPDLASRVATAVWTPWWYLGRIALPFEPRAVYDFNAVGWTDWRVFVALGAWAALGVVLVRWRLRRLAVVVGVVVLALAPVGGFIPLRFLVADRYTLLPSLALLAACVTWLSTKLSKPALNIVVGLAAVPCLAINVGYQHAWKDEISLWEQTVRASPEHATVRMNLASAYGAAGRIVEAREQTAALLVRRPDDHRVLAQLFWLSAVSERLPPEELESRQAALAAADWSPDAVVEQANWCLSHGFSISAEALLSQPKAAASAKGLRMRAAMARRQQRASEAVELARQSIAAGETAATIDLVYALSDANRAEEGLRETEKEMPDPFSAALLRGAKAYALSKLGRLDEARAESAAALEAVQQLSTP